jgi:K+-transporting ATPase ATPase C chain
VVRRQLVSGLVMTVVLTVLLGVAYPLAVTVVSQTAFRHRADGTLLTINGRAAGSALIGQAFSDAGGNPLREYFQPRPSVAGKSGYDPTASGGSNLGPAEISLHKAVMDRAAAYRSLNGLAPGVPVPVDAVTASGSGLDPDISPANALDQVARVALARGLDPATVRRLVELHRRTRPWGFLGEDTVNVVDLNLALDRMGR